MCSFKGDVKAFCFTEIDAMVEKNNVEKYKKGMEN